MLCLKCQPSGVRETCLGAFSRIGVLKVHWECWSACNLSCGFCYRQTGKTLGTQNAKHLLRAVRTSGAETIVFAGGDPSLRHDLLELVLEAKNLGLRIEIQSNVHIQGKILLESLKIADAIGLSLDGPEDIHDRLRGRSGNYRQVIKCLEYLDRIEKKTIVRTVISRQNFQEVPVLGTELSRFKNIARWSLLEFTPVGEGFRRHLEFSIPEQVFLATSAKCMSAFVARERVDVFYGKMKMGAYALINPEGSMYGTSDQLIEGKYPSVGNILDEHLDELAQKLPFSIANHELRYGSIGNLKV